MSWSELTDWWIGEVQSDPTYEQVVTPLLMELLNPLPGLRYLDLGAGEGRVLRTISDMGGVVVGVDLSEKLARMAGSTLVGDISVLPIRDNSFNGVFSVLALEHVAAFERAFEEAARVTKGGGSFVLIANHPVWTAPGSTPISDHDGEVLWRPGEYFDGGSSDIPAGESIVTFHHRSLSEILNAAASFGWSLERMTEHPHHEIEGQGGIPRLLACRWRLLP